MSQKPKLMFHSAKGEYFSNEEQMKIAEYCCFGTPGNWKMHSSKKSLGFSILVWRDFAQHGLHASRAETGPGRGNENERPVESGGRDFWVVFGEGITLAQGS